MQALYNELLTALRSALNSSAEEAYAFLERPFANLCKEVVKTKGSDLLGVPESEINLCTGLLHQALNLFKLSASRENLIKQGVSALDIIYLATNRPVKRARNALELGNFFVSHFLVEKARLTNNAILKDPKFQESTRGPVGKDLISFQLSFYQLDVKPVSVLGLVDVSEKVGHLLVSDLASLHYAVNVYFYAVHAQLAMNCPWGALNYLHKICELLDYDREAFFKHALAVGTCFERAYRQLLNLECQPSSQFTRCGFCGKFLPFKESVLCTPCKSITYCNQTCTNSHHLEHRATCRRVLNIRESVAKEKTPPEFYSPFQKIAQFLGLLDGTPIFGMPEIYQIWENDYTLVFRMHYESMFDHFKEQLETIAHGVDVLRPRIKESGENQGWAEHWQILLLRARIFLEQNQPEQALLLVKEAISLLEQPKPPGSKIDLGFPEEAEQVLFQCYLATRRYQEAFLYYRNSLSEARHTFLNSLRCVYLSYVVRDLAMAKITLGVLSSKLPSVSEAERAAYEKLEQQINKLLHDRRLRKNAYPYAPKICAGCYQFCPTGVKYSRCSGCDSVYYCNAECQVKHWELHRPVCKEIRKERKAALPKQVV